MARIIAKLTAKQVKEAKPQEKLYRLYDGEGLQVCIHPTGSKVYRYDYHDQNKKRRTYTIGNANLMSLSDARLKRDELRILLNSGEEIQNSSTHTYESVFMDWYERWRVNVTERHHQRALATMKSDVFPKIGNMKIDEIETKDVIKALLAVEERESLEQLKKTKSFVKMAFAFAVDRGLCKYNPAAQISDKAFKIRKAKNHKSIDKDKIYQFFSLFDDDRFNLSVRLCTEFILRNMTRASESAHAEWSEYDEKNKYLIIPPERMKARKEHIIPLSTQSIEILERIKQQSGDCKYIFPSKNFSGHLSESYPLAAVKRCGIDTTIHGLRHLASTILNETGMFNSDAIELCLAHQDSHTTRGTYNDALHIKERKRILQWWSDFIDRCSTRAGNIESLEEIGIK